MVIILITLVVGMLVRRGISKAFSLRKVSSSSSYAISQLLYFLILIVGFYAALSTLGIDLTGIAVIAGALSVGIGFGLQSILSNFVSGILILFEKNVTPGDIIQLESGVIGIVDMVNIRSTVIETPDRKRMIIPNTEIISKKLTNWSLEKKGVYQVSIPLSVKREADQIKVKEVLLNVAKKSGFSCNEPSPLAHLVKLTEGLQEWEMVIWVNQKPKKTQEESSFSTLTVEIESQLNQEGITLEKVACPTALFIK
ncbi:MAG: mechanosensitive ion channel [Simkaniaceae bacterium]|nr:MAG: mechanosensitive ion channel [Simkaniaceae bacterium]